MENVSGSKHLVPFLRAYSVWLSSKQTFFRRPNLSLSMTVAPLDYISLLFIVVKIRSLF
jgi:hypothetical protein